MLNGEVRVYGDDRQRIERHSRANPAPSPASHYSRFWLDLGKPKTVDYRFMNTPYTRLSRSILSEEIKAYTIFFSLLFGLWASHSSLANPGGTLGTPREFHTATRLLDGRVLVAAGRKDFTPDVTDSAELYDPATNTWSATGRLNEGREFHSAVLLLDGRVFVTGGIGFGSNTIDSAELYDPATGRWTFAASPSSPHFRSDPVVLSDGKVLVASGRTVEETPSAELYDPVTDTWTSTGDVIHPRSDYHSTLLFSGKVLIAGGSSQSGLVAEADLYDPATDAFNSTGSLLLPRTGHAQVLLANGRVLFAGGAQKKRGKFKVLREAETYDPATGLWTITGSMRVPRIGFTVNLLADGRIFAAGGADLSGALAAIEEYDPGVGRWRPLQSALARARSNHTTTALLNGDLIIAGGVGGNPSVLIPQAELFVGPR